MDEAGLMMVAAFTGGVMVAAWVALLIVALRESRVRAQATRDAEMRFERLKAEVNMAAALEIVILDVKTGGSAGLTREQRAIREAIAAQRVYFEVAHVHPDTLAVHVQ